MLATGSLLYVAHDGVFHLKSGASGGQGGAVAFSPDGKALASGTVGTLALMDVETGKLRWKLPAPSWGAVSVAFAPDGRTLASSSGGVRLWNARTGALERTLAADKEGVGLLAFSPDGAT